MCTASHSLKDRIAEIQNQLESHKARIDAFKIPKLVVA